ncbi:coiled-coil domain-containing protein 27 [Lepisosteus oculatus]|uniref:coiled-coil domain-containing protein 27 n=1 Tax=Lepisosteus oculatus TaxID=7918 RepID=UPI0007403C5F|nr:PREDICTED: coiled-coil domain-containing protein 27 [Lepisosteus oculatus]XP_015192685.1 PREDICTED: coiled-coil domain-containing protein 27 [Lepisosteus oculatus]
MMKTLGNKTPLARPQTAHRHCGRSSYTRPVQRKTCWTPSNLQENQPPATMMVAKDLQGDLHNEKVHLPSIEDYQASCPGTNTSADHPKASRSAPATRGAWTQSVSYPPSSSTGTSDSTRLKLQPNTSIPPSPASASSACRFLLSQSLSELHNNTSIDRISREVQRNSPALATSAGGKCPWYIALLHEKEQSLLMLGDEITRLSEFEAECVRKDHVIEALQEKVTELTHQLSLARNEEVIKAQAELILRLGEEIKHLRSFEEEASRKDTLIAGLREEIEILKRASPQFQRAAEISENEENDPIDNETGLVKSQHKSPDTWELNLDKRSEMDKNQGLESELQMKELKATNEKLVKELQEMKSNYTISTGTVCSLRRSLSARETELAKVGHRQERLRRELRDRMSQLQAMSKKFSCLRDGKRNEELMADLEKENFTLQKHIAQQQQELSEGNTVVAELKAQQLQLQQELVTERTRIKELEKNSKECQGKRDSLQQQHNQAKVSLEHLQSRFERIRGKIIQAAYCAPGAKPPHTEISDSELLCTMQKIIDDRSQFHQMLTQKGEKVPPLFTTETQPVAKPKPILTRKS